MAILYSKKTYAFTIFILLLLLVLYLIINPIFIYKNAPNNILVDKNRLVSDVRVLTSIDPPRSYLNLESLNKAADYIVLEFTKTECELEIQKYIIDGTEYKNIICSFGIKNPKRLVVGAHYDVFSKTPGADDNASGIAGILELARILAKEQPELKYRIDLVAYTLEEPPFFRTDSMGSAKHAQYLKKNDVKLAGVISLEMIGYFSNEENSQKYPTSLLKIFYPDKGNFIVVVGKFGQQGIVRKVKRNIIENSDIDARSINAPTIIPGIDFSDHLNYWRQEYEAVMITDTAFYRNSNYHLESDTIEKLDFAKMKEVVRGVYFTVINF